MDPNCMKSGAPYPLLRGLGTRRSSKGTGTLLCMEVGVERERCCVRSSSDIGWTALREVNTPGRAKTFRRELAVRCNYPWLPIVQYYLSDSRKVGLAHNCFALACLCSLKLRFFEPEKTQRVRALKLSPANQKSLFPAVVCIAYQRVGLVRHSSPPALH